MKKMATRKEFSDSFKRSIFEFNEQKCKAIDEGPIVYEIGLGKKIAVDSAIINNDYYRTYGY